jgi:hypothetical protein
VTGSRIATSDYLEIVPFPAFGRSSNIPAAFPGGGGPKLPSANSKP